MGATARSRGQPQGKLSATDLVASEQVKAMLNLGEFGMRA